MGFTNCSLGKLLVKCPFSMSRDWIKAISMERHIVGYGFFFIISAVRKQGTLKKTIRIIFIEHNWDSRVMGGAELSHAIIFKVVPYVCCG